MEEPIKHIWTTKSVYVDTDTGEELTKYQVEQNYTILKKSKHVQTDAYSGKKYVEIINQCRRNRYRQQTIEFK